jgi:dihydrofolate reductase
MEICLVAAVARNLAIGRGGRLPWRLPADLSRFRRLTWGHPVLMGRRTFESIGRPLEGRTNIVLTRDPAWSRPGCLAAHSGEEALLACGDGTAHVIGGASVYALFLPAAVRMYITHVDAEPEADAFFPRWDPAAWETEGVEEGTVDADNPVPHRFAVYRRIGAAQGLTSVARPDSARCLSRARPIRRSTRAP